MATPKPAKSDLDGVSGSNSTKLEPPSSPRNRQTTAMIPTMTNFEIVVKF